MQHMHSDCCMGWTASDYFVQNSCKSGGLSWSLIFRDLPRDKLLHASLPAVLESEDTQDLSSEAVLVCAQSGCRVQFVRECPQRRVAITTRLQAQEQRQHQAVQATSVGVATQLFGRARASYWQLGCGVAVGCIGSSVVCG
jgi:hypothetical protein